TASRGLAGGYNANVLREAIRHLEAEEGRGVDVRVTMVGKKGISYFKFLRREVAEPRTDIGEKPRFEQIEPLANDLMDRFTRGEIASAHVAYMRFLSAGQQRPEVVQLLPLAGSNTAIKKEEGEATPGKAVEYEFSPSPQELLDELLPAVVRVRLFQAFTDAAVSEQVARMVAMKAATDAAGDMIKSLTREDNRARHTH